ncbi:MAG: hypothetical protein JWO76_382 [Nocardioides sp.]|nr:hypothetical protein [Nocardioides sp.]
MASIDDQAPATTGTPGPRVALRLVTTYDDTTRRIDLQLRGSQGVVVENGVATPFPTDRLWPVVRELLPPLDLLRTAPTGRPLDGGQAPGPGFVEDCRAMAVLATVVGDDERDEHVAVRTWLTTDDELWRVTPHADGTSDVRSAPAGSVAELLIWDVTAAMEALVRVLETAS